MISALRRSVMTIATSEINPKPIVAVIGTTGVGKSQLAISLAQSLSNPTTASPTSTSANESRTRGHDDHDRGSTHSQTTGLVLSADSMQLYKGLDVITNKVTPEEMGGVEHWGLDMVTPGQGGSWEVGKWCSEADKRLSAVPPTTLPIICGGTHYFIQHFLFPPDELNLSRPASPMDGTLAQPGTSRGSSGKQLQVEPPSTRWRPPCPLPPTPDLDPELRDLLETFWTQNPTWPRTVLSTSTGSSSCPGTDAIIEAVGADHDQRNAEAGPSKPISSRPTVEDNSQLLALHRLLSAVDPKEAGRWHWRDGRKVRRGLERWWERGGRGLNPSSSSAVDGLESKEGVKAQGKGRKARFRTLIFWVYEPLETLRPRLDRRVDRMLENGLLREIAELREIAQRVYGSTEATDHTEGIFQAIGYKEFSALPLPPPTPLTASLPAAATNPAFKAMLDRTKLSTHQYARSQLKWIRKQLLPAAREAQRLGGEVHVYVVPGGASGETVAEDIFHSFLSGDEMPDPRTVGHHPDAGNLLEQMFSSDDTVVADTAARQELNSRKDCPVCSEPGRPYSISIKEWDTHLKSKIHKTKTNLAKNGGKQGWIELQKAEGERIRLEREAAKANAAAAASLKVGDT